MATYIVLGQFTEQGIRNVKDTTKRAEALKDLAKRFGSTVTSTYWTIGQYDVVAMIEAPDDMALTGLLLSLGEAGNIRTQTLRAFSANDMGQILGKLK